MLCDSQRPGNLEGDFIRKLSRLALRKEKMAGANLFTARLAHVSVESWKRAHYYIYVIEEL